MTRKFLPYTIAKSFNKAFVHHLAGDFETCFATEEKQDVRVWAWGLLDYMTGEYQENNHIDGFFDSILNDNQVYDIGFHNLKFDGSFIIPQLFKRGYKYLNNSVFMDKWKNGEDLTGYFTHNITAMGQWFNIIIMKDKHANKSTPAFVYIWDTLKLFPVKLSELAIQYNTGVQKIKEDNTFYNEIRPEGHVLTERESRYLKHDLLVLGDALKKQYEKYGTIYRTQASKAFTYFKHACVDEAGNPNYKMKYEGFKQWAVPDVAGLEDYKGAIVRYLPKEVRKKINESGAKLVDAFEYYIPDFFAWQDIKKAYTGGISFVNPLYQGISINKPVGVIDENSMYPDKMRNKPIPYGRFTKKEGQPNFKKEKFWIACARVSFKLKKEYNLPCIQIKEKYGRQWLSMSTDYMNYGEIDPWNEDILFFTSVDYETYKENYDFHVHRWLFYYHFPHSANADGKRFVDKLFNEKQEADNIMNKLKKKFPDTYKEMDEYIQASLDRQEAKVRMNSAYGKHGTKYFLYAKDSVYVEGEPVHYVPEKELSRDPDKEPSHYYCPYAAFITAYARQDLVRTWHAFEGRALYCDTDSIHFLGEDIPEQLHSRIDWEKTGALGLWKIEGTFAKARYIRSKTYIEVDKDDKAVITCAGATPEIKKLMNWENFRAGFSAWDECDKHNLDREQYSKLTPKQYPSGVALEPVPFEIKSISH